MAAECSNCGSAGDRSRPASTKVLFGVAGLFVAVLAIFAGLIHDAQADARLAVERVAIIENSVSKLANDIDWIKRGIDEIKLKLK